MILALVGNQNCGKTTLFNQLTGSNQHVGNFPGVTVEQKTGKLKKHTDVTVVDLPGIYSLSPYTNEEIVSRNFILKEKPHGIINIIDSTNIERNLYLTLQLIELEVPIVVALNMIDEFYGNGGSIKLKEFFEILGVPVIPISASKNQGVDDLVKTVIHTTKHYQKPARIDFCDGALHRCLHAVAHLIEDHVHRVALPLRFAATKVIEGDPLVLDSLKLSQNERETIEHCIKEMETDLNTDHEAALADMRYEFIEKLTAKTIKKPKESKEEVRSTRIDKLITNKYLAIPTFLGIMLLIFFLTFEVIGLFLSDILALGIDSLAAASQSLMETLEINPLVIDLVINGVFAGVGAVLSFLPIIVVLFFFLSILEDSGYMARVSFIMDKPLRKLGLSGKSFVPMLIGFGCSVPAIMATRTLSSERDRKMTIMLIPFMSCSAKLPIYALLTSVFFKEYSAFFMMGLYLFGIISGIIVACIFKGTVFKGNPIPFIMELPNYRLPSAKSVVLLMWDKAKDFLFKAFTIIFLASLVLWILQTFDFRFNVVADSKDSILATLGSSISFLFAPLGFNDYRAVTSLFSGFIAKEAVVSSLAVLSGTTVDTLSTALYTIFTPISIISFLVFTLLYTPCVAAVATIKKELGAGWTTIMVIFQIVVAYAISFVVFQLLSLVMGVI